MSNETGLRRKGDGWQAYYDHGGKQHTATFTTKTEARNWRTQQKAAIASGKWIAPSDEATWVKDWLDTWLELRRPTLSEGSYTRYESIIRNHLKPAFGHRRIGHLSRTDVQRWVNDMEPSQAHTNFPVLRMAMSGAVRDRMIERAPTDDVDLPTHKSKRMTFLEPDELRDLLTHEPDEWVRDIILGLAFTGARWGELAALTPGDINPLRGTIRLFATKTNTERTIPIAAPLAEVVERRLALGHDTVWGMAAGTPLNGPNFRTRHWYPLLERAGIGRHIRVHDLRHTTASWLIRGDGRNGGGMNPVQVCAWMGHSKPTQTLDTYAHLFGTDMQDMASALEAMWAAPPDDGNVVGLGVAK